MRLVGDLFILYNIIFLGITIGEFAAVTCGNRQKKGDGNYKEDKYLAIKKVILLFPPLRLDGWSLTMAL